MTRHRLLRWTQRSWRPRARRCPPQPRPGLQRPAAPRRRPAEHTARARAGRRYSALPPRWCLQLASPGRCARNRRSCLRRRHRLPPHPFSKTTQRPIPRHRRLHLLRLKLRHLRRRHHLHHRNRRRHAPRPTHPPLPMRPRCRQRLQRPWQRPCPHRHRLRHPPPRHRCPVRHPPRLRSTWMSSAVPARPTRQRVSRPAATLPAARAAPRPQPSRPTARRHRQAPPG